MFGNGAQKRSSGFLADRLKERADVAVAKSERLKRVGIAIGHGNVIGHEGMFPSEMSYNLYATGHISVKWVAVK